MLTEIWPPIWLQDTGQGSPCLLWFLNWSEVGICAAYYSLRVQVFGRKLQTMAGLWGMKGKQIRPLSGFLLFCLGVFLVISWDFLIKNPSERVATAMAIWNFQLWFSTPYMDKIIVSLLTHLCFWWCYMSIALFSLYQGINNLKKKLNTASLKCNCESNK